MKAIRRTLLLTLVAVLGAAPYVTAGQAAAPTSSPPVLTAEQMEQFLLTAKMVSARPVGEGVTNTRRATFSDGRITHDAQIQTVDEARAVFDTPRGVELNFKDSYRYNIAGYRLAVMLGLDNVPMSVQRDIEGRPAALTWWLDDVAFDEQERIKRRTTGPDPQRYASYVHIQRVFDELIQNMDRNTGNILWSADGRMWMIDHTRAFRLGKDLRNPKLLERIERTLFARLRGLTEPGLKEAVGDSLNELEVAAVVARAKLLVAFFEKRIADLGEGRVLYTRR
jgi:hypothetical protein